MYINKTLQINLFRNLSNLHGGPIYNLAENSLCEISSEAIYAAIIFTVVLILAVQSTYTLTIKHKDREICSGRIILQKASSVIFNF